jgi:hypothetical protein
MTLIAFEGSWLVFRVGIERPARESGPGPALAPRPFPARETD